MPRRKTSRVRKGRAKAYKQLELRVNSPRIFGFGCLRFLGRVCKLLVALGAVGGIVYGARIGLQKVFIQNPEFQLQEIQLQTNGRMTEEWFAKVTDLDLSATVFAFTLSEARQKLEARPGIIRAEVGRRLPGTLKVDLRERIPVAWLECRSLGIQARDVARGLLVDREGVVLPCEPWWEEQALGLPVVVTPEARRGDFAIGKKMRHREAGRALHLIRLSHRMLSGDDWSLPVVGVQNDYSLVAATSRGTVATFGMYDHQRQLSDLKALLRHAQETNRTVSQVNLIPERNIPVNFVPGEARGTGGIRKKTPPPEGNRLEQDIRAILNRS